MRSLLLLQSFALLAAAQSATNATDIPADANRTPDALPLDFLKAVVAPTYTIAVGATSEDIPYASATAIAAASSDQVATPLSVFPAVTASAINAAGEDGSVPTTTAAPERRHVEYNLEKRKACDVQPSNANYYSVKTYTSTDGYSSFIADKTISSVANAATAPAGYSESFKNLQGASSAYAYMGLMTVPTYDTAKCASECDKKSGCLAFNIYFELDPSKEPGTGCTNPDPIINIVCTFWGGALDKSTATNVGQWRSKFHVATAGSNGYTSNKIGGSINGWTGPAKFNNAILNAPLRDCANTWTYLGYKLFQDGPFDVNLCAAACNAQNEYNIAHPPTNGDNLPLCAAFSTYQLTQNTKSGSKIIGQMCNMYTSAWDASYAVNTVSYDDSIGASYTYSLSFFYSMDSRQPICSSDIDYLRSSGSDFCTSYISYNAPATTIPSTTTPAVSTIYSTITVSGTTTTFTSTNVQTVTVTKAAAKRAIEAAGLFPRAVATPASITAWPASKISAACSKVATGTTTATSIVTAVAPLTTSFTTTTSYTTISTATISTATQSVAANLITNGDFDTGSLDPWIPRQYSGATGAVTSSVSHNGGSSWKLSKTSANTYQYGGIEQLFSLKSYTTYNYSFWAKHVEANAGATATFWIQGVLSPAQSYTGGTTNQIPAGSDWTFYSGQVNWSWNNLQGVLIQVEIGTGSDKTNPGAIYLDQIYFGEA